MKTKAKQPEFIFPQRKTMKNQFEIRVTAVAFAICLVVALSVVEAHAQTNLVANGSFEAGPAGE